MKAVILAVTAVLLTGCTADPSQWTTETTPVLIVHPAPSTVPIPPDCAPIDPAITAQARRMTQLDGIRAGNTDALTAALMHAEAAKNASLRHVLAAYERCRAKGSWRFRP